MTEQNTPQVDINTANADTLAELPGISSKLAQNIIDRREEQPFETIEDITFVKGISNKLFGQLQPLVTVAGVETGAEPEEAPQDDDDDKTADESVNEAEPAKAPAPIETDDAEESPTEDADETEAALVAEPEESPEESEADEAEEPEPVSEADETEEQEAGEEPEPPAEVEVEESSAAEVTDMPTEENDDGDYMIVWPNEDEEPAETAATNEDDVPEPVSEPAAEPAPQAAPASTPSSSENFRRPWLLMIVGTLLGAFIALGVLYIVNDGVLVFANHPKVMQMETALTNLEQREATLNQKISELQDELTVLNAMKETVETNQTEIRKLNQTDDTLTEQLSLVDGRSTALEDRAKEVEDKVSTQGKDISSLQVATNKLDDAIQAVEEDAARFDSFLNGLRELLIQAQE